MKSLLVFALFLTIALPVQSTVIVNYYENGADLVFDWSGSWNTSSIGSGYFSGQYIQSNGLADDFYGFTGSYGRIANNITYTQTLGTGLYSLDFLKHGVATGDTFGLDWISPTNVYLYAPINYVAYQDIVGSLTISNTSIADIGLADASFDFGQYGDVHFRGVSVPEPSTIVLLGLGLVGLGLSRRKQV